MMLNSWKKICVSWSVALGMTLASHAAEHLLTDKGQAFFAIVPPATATTMEKEAVDDLTGLLKMITGADFLSSNAKPHSIFIGVPAPSDKQPLKNDERRIVTENGNIYIYGQGKRGNVNAIYDFLKDEIGFKTFTPWGDVKLPRKTRLALGDLHRSLIPSIPQMTVSGARETYTAARFARRNAIWDRADDTVGSFDTHAGQQLIPTGKIPFGGKVGSIRGPFKYFKDKKYFETNPEFFAMGKEGKRVTTMQLCYSNPKLRDEIEKNIIIMLNAEHYQGGRVIVGLGQDDNGGKFCYCAECEALEKKYRHPAGAYYDFLLEMGRRFEKSYPDVLLSFLAYRKEQTLTPSPIMTRLPANLLPSYAPLGCDFLKPLTHETNVTLEKNFNAWGKISNQMHWWAYPTTYPRPIISQPLCANLHRLVENFRLAAKNKVVVAYCEYGNGPYFNAGFNDLRNYMLSELCRNINTDEMTIKREFSEICYGPAAPMMLEYIAELEKMEAETTYGMRWNPDVRNMRYTTDENLLRWEKNFDKMETLVQKRARLLLNLRRARYILDQTVIARWPYISQENQKQFESIDAIIDRALNTLKMDAESRYATVTDKASRERRIKNFITYQTNGLNQFIAVIKQAKPLPDEFKGKLCYRILPDRNKLGLDIDETAPFGLCNTGVLPKAGRLFVYRSAEFHRNPMWAYLPPSQSLNWNRFKEICKGFDGKYYYYPLGHVTLEYDCSISYNIISPQGGFYLGHLWDAMKSDPQVVDLFVAMAALPDKEHVKLGELVVIPVEAAPVSKTGKSKTSANDNVDAFQ